MGIDYSNVIREEQLCCPELSLTYSFTHNRPEQSTIWVIVMEELALSPKWYPIPFIVHYF